MLVFGLAAGVAAELSLSPAPPARSIFTVSTSVQPQPPASASAAASVSSILARPLFAPSRRPPPGQVQPGVAAANQATPGLTGIIIAGQERWAIFAGEHERSVALDGHVGPYRITAISPDTVTLAGPDGPVVLRPKFRNAPEPPQPSASAMPLPSLSAAPDAAQFNALAKGALSIYQFSPSAPPPPRPPVPGFGG